MKIQHRTSVRLTFSYQRHRSKKLLHRGNLNDSKRVPLFTYSPDGISRCQCKYSANRYGLEIIIKIFINDDLKLQATEEKAENARLSSFVGALALGDLVKSTLGPKGMNKILQSASTGDINVTNDGATILKAIQLDNAAAKILVNISKVQDDEVGDGTTTVTVLAAELLREAEKLIAQKIHPQTIVEGYRIASLAALKALENAAVDHS